MTTTLFYNPLGVEMADIAGMTRQYVKGDRLTDQGYLDGRTTLHVAVDSNGDAYMVEDYADSAGYPLKVEVWPDGIYLGRNFSPDIGELERCGIRANLCGGATHQDPHA